ncbi:glycosyltransferase family 2 protein [Thalassospira sp.]|uniref:glycosyltransferase family 2 protein n=1 Tax=Thalassospira sp. TaxID=1912094 RepID=UPI001B011916|nr:glycosyltransferase family 2 protein [Thalassospira sp.]MBO6805981.1 glycosyltransferase family 2 protein [Thalassospira sp.]
MNKHLINPEVTVIIPAYNRESLLPRTVNSVLSQDFSDFELLIVDDGSEDLTADVAEQFASIDPRVRVIRHCRNRGEAAARNTGLENSRGRFIAFLDSDDCWLPGKLTRQWKLLSKAEAEFVAVVTSQIVVAEDGSETRENSWHFRHPVNQKNILTRGCALGLGGNILMRRQPALDAGKFDTSLKLYVDVDWLCRFLENGKVLTLDEPYTVYNKAELRPGKAVKDATDDFIRKNSLIISKYSFLTRCLIRANFNRSISLSYRMQKKTWESTKYSLLAIVNNPFVPIGNYVEIIDTIFGSDIVNKIRLVKHKYHKQFKKR